MALADELAYMTATDMAARIRRRQLSPVEIVDAVIERIEERNPSLNAFVFKGYDDARQRAEKAEHAVIAGEELGPLHGVPTAMKDLFDFKPGWPATFGGVRALKDLVIDAYCVFAERIEQAGAILIGKTNSPVMGFRGVTDNYLFGPTVNPFDTAFNPGGSSGGSAAAVADGLVPFAEGTDGGGSIRIPAAWTGVYGYKASFGRVPMVMRPDAWAGTNPFIYEGPLTRTVEDAALVLNALSGYDPRDPVQPRREDRLPARDAPLDQGHAHRLQPRPRRLPGRSAHREGRRRGRRGVQGGRRHGRGGQARHQARPARALRPLVPDDHPALDRRVRAHAQERLRPARRAPRRLPAGVPVLGRQGRGHDGARPDGRSRRSARRSTTRCRACSPTTTCSSARR